MARPYQQQNCRKRHQIVAGNGNKVAVSGNITMLPFQATMLPFSGNFVAVFGDDSFGNNLFFRNFVASVDMP